ncbi:MAG: hypothetical protein AAFP76_09240 [Bacteroidota bacterium]
MKKYWILLLCMGLFSCQKEELTIVEENQESSFLADAQLTRLMQSVTSHDGSFDDIIDQSSCFSINFPYQILLNGESHNVNSVNDLLAISSQDIIEPVFPLTITTGDYVEEPIQSMAVFEEFITRCANGTLYNDRITCIDFTYPVRISVYNTENNDFETIMFTHDKETFTRIDLFESGVLASIDYPIELRVQDTTALNISSNNELKASIMQMVPLCQ